MDPIQLAPWQQFGLTGLILGGCFLFIWRLWQDYRGDVKGILEEARKERKESQEVFTATLDEMRSSFSDSVSKAEESCEKRHVETQKAIHDFREENMDLHKEQRHEVKNLATIAQLKTQFPGGLKSKGE